MNGLHLIADLYQCSCDSELLKDRETLRKLCVEGCVNAGLTSVGDYFFQFESDGEKAGVTGTVVLAESHLAIHTWPETGDVTLDVYVCNFSRDNSDKARQVFTCILEALQAKENVSHAVTRGQIENN